MTENYRYVRMSDIDDEPLGGAYIYCIKNFVKLNHAD